MATELFTIATPPTAGLARLQSSLTKFGASLTVLGQNEAQYWGHAWRWKTFIRAAAASSADVVIHCDAYDTLCMASPAELEAKFASLAHPIVFSYEAQAQPEFWLELNPGLMMANRAALRAVFTEECLEALFPDHFNDMYQIQSLYSWQPEAFKLDRDGVLFYTQGARAPALVVQNNRVVNPVTGRAPAFVHAPNHGDLSVVEEWVSGVMI